MQAKRIDPVMPLTTYDITGLTGREVRALMKSLKHCSGGHLEDSVSSSSPESVFSLPGMLYNELTSKLGLPEYLK